MVEHSFLLPPPPSHGGVKALCHSPAFRQPECAAQSHFSAYRLLGSAPWACGAMAPSSRVVLAGASWSGPMLNSMLDSSRSVMTWLVHRAGIPILSRLAPRDPTGDSQRVLSLNPTAAMA